MCYRSNQKTPLPKYKKYNNRWGWGDWIQLGPRPFENGVRSRKRFVPSHFVRKLLVLVNHASIKPDRRCVWNCFGESVKCEPMISVASVLFSQQHEAKSSDWRKSLRTSRFWLDHWILGRTKLTSELSYIPSCYGWQGGQTKITI